MKTIYLISSDGYSDSINLDHYATNKQEVEQLLEKELEITGMNCGDVKVDLEKLEVKFMQWGDYEEPEDAYEKIYHLQKITHIQTEEN
jgi:hypothetical protein